jgi:hypothetical protein
MVGHEDVAAQRKAKPLPLLLENPKNDAESLLREGRQARMQVAGDKKDPVTHSKSLNVGHAGMLTR